MLPLELRRLRYFLVLAEELHFARAAQRLNMAQPPLSAQIKKLEEEVGCRLFVRSTRNVAITEAGRVLLNATREAMFELERAVHTAQQTERGESGLLRLGFISSGGVTFLPQLLRKLKNSLPAIQPETRQYSSNKALDALLRRTIDLAVVRTPLIKDDLMYKPIFKDRVVLVMAEDHPLSENKRLHLSQMSHEQFILYPPNEGYAAYSVVQRACLKAGFVPSVASFVDDVYGMLGLVSAGIGVALMPAAIAKLQVEGLKFFALPEVEEYFELSLVWHADDDRKLIQSVVRILTYTSSSII